jgi:ornithine cyclodeaminase
LHHAADAGVIAPDAPVVELGEVCGGRQSGRADEQEITICDLTGVGVQDTTIAIEALRVAQAMKLGKLFEV